MSADRVLQQAAAAADVAGAAAVGERVAAIADQVRLDFPGVTAMAADDGVWLTAPGLVPRAFGGRHHAADPRLAGLVTLMATGGGL